MVPAIPPSLPRRVSRGREGAVVLVFSYRWYFWRGRGLCTPRDGGNVCVWAGVTRAAKSHRSRRGAFPASAGALPPAPCRRGDGAAGGDGVSPLSQHSAAEKSLLSPSAFVRARRQQVLTPGVGGVGAAGLGRWGGRRAPGAARRQRPAAGKTKGSHVLRAPRLPGVPGESARPLGRGGGDGCVGGVKLVPRGMGVFSGWLAVLEDFGGVAKLWMHARSPRYRAARAASVCADRRVPPAAPGLPQSRR